MTVETGRARAAAPAARTPPRWAVAALAVVPIAAVVAAAAVPRVPWSSLPGYRALPALARHALVPVHGAPGADGPAQDAPVRDAPRPGLPAARASR